MISFFIINTLILAILCVLLIFLSWIWPPDSPWAPWWRTNDTVADAACRLAGVSSTDIVYELGSGEGNMLLVAAKKYHAIGVGIEIDYFRAFLAKMVIAVRGYTQDITIIRGNLFHEDISQATMVFVYLVPKTLQRLLPKLEKELKPGTRIVSLRYPLSLPMVKEDKKHALFLYRIGKKSVATKKR